MFNDVPISLIYNQEILETNCLQQETYDVNYDRLIELNYMLHEKSYYNSLFIDIGNS